MLIHDGQYADSEYPNHVGWGHSALSHALSFADRSGADRTILFHHDPGHSDERLDLLGEEAREQWRRRGGDPEAIELGFEGAEYDLGARSGAAEMPARAAAPTR
jgi:ribonuclease BN (tRNA processing enzyme)